MKQWLDKHTYRTFMNEWPFGKGEVLDDGKDYVEGATHYAGNWSRQSANFVTARAAANFASTIVAFKGFDYFDEVRKLKLKKPLPCYLELRTNGLAPGLLDVKLWGYGGNPDPELKAGVLSEFRLRFETSNKGTHSQHQHPGRPSIAYGNNLHHARVHVEMGKAWLADCENHHGDTCRKRDSAITIRKPTFLRLVDVENYSVVELRGANADCRYLALSYVWGEKEKAAPLMLQESNKSLFTSKNGLKESFDTDMPKTLRDAIKTTKRMEERYIWIDSLCIQQDSEEEKKQQIKMMGRIYGNAIVTIVAADAADSNAGLGIDERTRKLEQVKQPVKEGIHLMLPLPKPMDLDESVWDTRKWTFQEKLLSRRLMIFMDGQVHWQCRKLLAFEDMTAQEKGLPLEYRESEWLNPSLQSAGIHTPRDIDINGSIKKSLGKTQIVRSLAFREYVKCVELYTSRQLAGYHDNLDPLTGLLQTLELCFRCQVVQGLPEIHLDAALLWQPGEKLTRSPKSTKGDTQPSWSWVGWDGKITYPKPFYVLDDDTGLKRLETKQGLEGFRPLVQWHTWKNRKLKLLNSTGLGIPLFVENANELPAEWEKIPPGSTALDGYYQSMKLHDLLYKARHSMRQKSKRDQKDKAIKSTRHSPSDQYLVFRTSCSKGISFGEPIQPAASPSPSNLQDGAEFSLAETPESNRPDRYQLLSTTTFLTIGEITLDSSTPSSFDPNKHTFLVLSEGHALLSGYEDDEYPYYNVMLVEQTEGKIAYRLGIGRVEKAAWMGTSPAPFLDWTILG